jgi:hypothetical protein
MNILKYVTAGEVLGWGRVGCCRHDRVKIIAAKKAAVYSTAV